MIVLAGILVIVICLAIIVIVSKDSSGGVCFTCGVVVTLISLIMVDNFNSSKAPSALDVYRGKTSLEIVYRDSIPVDSIVIYREYK